METGNEISSKLQVEEAYILWPEPESFEKDGPDFYSKWPEQFGS